jgi:very-short-patch-repair endonuclease
MTKNWSKIKMREKGETEYRHEQFVLQKWLIKLRGPIRIEMEYPIYSTDGALIAKIDVACLDEHVAYRINGESHTSPSRDQRQKEALELRGWKVIDCNKDSFEWKWLWD